MPYFAKGKCVYKKDGGAKVGCTKGSVKKYLAALHANANESTEVSLDEIRLFVRNVLAESFLAEDLVSELRNYKKWKRQNVTLRGMKEIGQENKAGAMLGNGLYTAALGNKSLAKQYGDVNFVVNGKPKNPIAFKDLNLWQIWFQGFVYKTLGYKNMRDFEARTNIADEIKKLGYDGIEIKGREMVNFSPEDVMYFQNENQLIDYYERHFENKTESTLQEDYPSFFSMDEFKVLKSFKDRVAYCDANLKKIGAGSSRIVYKIDDEKVLKLAKNKKGIVQNDTEIDRGTHSYFSNILAHVFDSDENGLWVEMELAIPINKYEFRRLTNFDINDVAKYLINFQDSNNGKGEKYHLQQPLLDRLDNDEFIQSLREFIAGTDALAGDFGAATSYGLVKRDGGQELVLVDFGLTDTDYAKHYQKSMYEGEEKELNDNFKTWFGDSKVVDASGKPLMVHHGTSKKFSKFNIKKSAQPIIWFTSNKSSIESGEVGAAGKGHIMDLYASIKNPAGWDEYQKYGLGQIESMGYDGAILPDPDGTITGFVFEPTQLKSITNKGEWNSGDKNIFKEDLESDKKKLNKYVYHTSNINNRNRNDKNGIIPHRGVQWMEDTPIKGNAVFATNSDNPKDWFDSTYDDDVWRIDTTKIPNVKWFIDPNFSWDKKYKHIYTKSHIPRSAIELIKQGSGEDLLEENKITLDEIERRESWKREINQIAKQLNVSLTNYLGSGVWGIAYEIPGNKVLKITEDEREIEAAKYLVGKKNELLADIYKVYSVKGSKDKKVIIMEKLEPLGPYKKLIEGFNQRFDKYYNPDLTWAEMVVNGYDEDFDNTLSPQLSSIYQDIMNIFYEAHNKGVFLTDMHIDNIGLKHGNLAAFDLS